MNLAIPAKSTLALLFLFVIFFVCLGVFSWNEAPLQAAGKPADLGTFIGNNWTQIWVASELAFQSAGSYENPFYDVEFDFVFTHRQSGTTYKVPAFWNGGQNFIVRYALTKRGLWDFTVECSDESNPLNGLTGTVACMNYDGEHEIYKRGFLKAEQRYFTYADGTPFFYLGDTHWHMALEEIDTKEKFEDGTVASRFEYTLMRRKELGFTVIQSEPLGVYDGDNSYFKRIFTEEFGEEQLARFQQYDKYFKLIAEMGFVHANAQFSYPTALGDAMHLISDEDLARLCRYWVARYSAYPVLWTLSQECDNDYYYGTTGQFIFTAETNPWKKVAEYMHAYDPYQHPLSAHQENSGNTLASNSAFRSVEGHNWWAAQINYDWSGGTQFDAYKNYWEYGAGKPGIEYEGRYDHFWTGTWGARLQGWLAFLNGMYGYGYGSAKIWSANETPGIWAGAIQNSVSDGLETLTYEDMDITWQESLALPAAQQMGYMKQFFSEYEWWKLEPCFDSEEYYRSDLGSKGDANRYSAAHIGDTVYIAYFYNVGRDTGAFKQLQEGRYVCTWFDPCTGASREPYRVNVDSSGILEIGEKPNNGDWVFSAVFDKPADPGTELFGKLLAAGTLLAVAAFCTALLVRKRRRAKGGI